MPCLVFLVPVNGCKVLDIKSCLHVNVCVNINFNIVLIMMEMQTHRIGPYSYPCLHVPPTSPFFVSGTFDFLPPGNEVWGKVIFSVACVKNSVQGGGGLPQCMLGYHPPQSRPPGSRHPPPPGADNPPRSRHPPGSRPPWEQTPQSRHPTRLEQTPPRSGHPLCAVHAGRYGQQAGGMHPTGMQSCLMCAVP